MDRNTTGDDKKLRTQDLTYTFLTYIFPALLPCTREMDQQQGRRREQSRASLRC